MSRRKLSVTDNKYTRGVVAVCAGSKKYPGASLLAVGGARAGNAGYVKFLSRIRELSLLVVSKYPDVVPISSLEKERFDSLLVGPGASPIAQIPKRISQLPLVLDSSAISIVVKKKSLISNCITVVTPHEGELKYLGKSYGALIQKMDRKSLAMKISAEFSIIVVLKGARTVIASPDGRVYVDEVGGAELATAGSGDVLAGLIASFLVDTKNGSDAFELVKEAVKLHSMAGRFAAKEFTSVTALEILDSLHHV